MKIAQSFAVTHDLSRSLAGGTNMRKLMTFLAVAVAITLSTGISRADLLSGCDTCQGSTYLLQYNPTPTIDGVTGDSIYDVFLTIDTSLYTGGGAFINAVAIKIANSVDITTSALLQAPGGTGSWILGTGGINAAGCDGSGSGFICASDTTGTAAPVPNATPYTWEFSYETADALQLGSLGSDIKAQYVDASGVKVGALVSEGITLQPCEGDTCGGGGGGGKVPEPGSIILLGSGLLLASVKLRKKLARS
jgi:PEP-CTERM motif